MSLLNLLLLAALINAYLPMNAAIVPLPSLEINALRDFYISLNGTNWLWLNDTESFGIPWDFDNSSSDPCSDHWQGIHCTCLTNNATTFPDRRGCELSNGYGYIDYDETYSSYSTNQLPEENCHVNKINLIQYNLVGTTPPSLGNLSYLQVLQLSDNLISGHIDSHLWQLHDLQSLVIHNNLLSGPIPSYMDSIAPNLTYLALAMNMLTGFVPDSLCKLSALKMLTISGYGINGTLPDCIGDLTHLDTFLVSHTSIIGSIPDSICNWHMIRDFTFYANAIAAAEGSFPTSCFGSSGTLQHIKVSNLPISGPIWPGICANHGLVSLTAVSCGLNGPLLAAATTTCLSLVNMPNLSYIDVQGNSFTGSIPSAWLHDLLVLNLSSNKLNGTIPAEGLLQDDGSSRLQEFIANFNMISGSLPSELASSQIAIFELRNNMITGSISQALCNNTSSDNSWGSLMVFRLDNNHLTGSLPDCIDNWSSLNHIDIGGNHLSGSLPDIICNLPSFQQLFISYNSFTGTLPSCMGSAFALQHLSIVYNQFTGSFSDTFCDWGSELVELLIFNNMFTGSLPYCVGNWSMLSMVQINNNYLSGSLPAGMSDWSLVNYLDISANIISGSLPEYIGGMNLLYQCYLSYNLLSGSLPDSICNWPRIGYLQIYSNQLTGTLPDCLAANWLGISQLYLWGNHINGTIADHWCYDHQHLQILDLWDNDLTGTLPPCIWYGNYDLRLLAVEMNRLTGPFFLSEEQSCAKAGVYNPNIRYITANGNSFTGAIPSCIGDLFPGLENLDLGNNHHMNGTIPVSLCHARHVYDLQLYGNDFTGTIPDCWRSDQVNLEQIVISDNPLLTGSLPVSLCNLVHLQSLLLGGNSLTGSIPNCYGMNMTDMIYFNLSSNQLTGTISDNICSMYSNTVFLAVNDNQLTEMIPSCLGGFSQLQYLFLSDNMLTGPLSFLRNGSAGAVPQLVELSIEHNQLSGPIFEDLAYATINRQSRRVLTQLLAQQNKFTGSLPTIDWERKYNISLSDAFGSLAVIDLAENRLSGKVDASLFIVAVSSLTSVILIKNCFSGTLAEDICLRESKLEILAFDGLSAAAASSHCRRHVAVYGSIPPCYYSLPSLRILHAAGNNFIGSLPSSDEVSANLTDLSLSHSDLRGTIPVHWQQRSWTNLDLSFNKLAGSLVDSHNDSQWTAGGPGHHSVKLDRNRLSGDIPSQYIPANDVNMLNGNLFSCQMDAANQLPEHDPYANSYSCGTDSLNLMLVVGGGLLAIAMMVLLVWLMTSRISRSKRQGNGEGFAGQQINDGGQIESQVMGEEDEDDDAEEAAGGLQSHHTAAVAVVDRITAGNNDNDDSSSSSSSSILGVSSQDIVISYHLSPHRRDQFYLPSPSAASHISAEEELEAGLDSRSRGSSRLKPTNSSSVRLRREEFADVKIDDDDNDHYDTVNRFPVAPKLMLPSFAFMNNANAGQPSSSSDANQYPGGSNTTGSPNSNHSNGSSSRNKGNASSNWMTPYIEVKDRCIAALQLLLPQPGSSLFFFMSPPQSAMEEEQLRVSLPAYHAAPTDSLARFLQVCDHQRRLYLIIGVFSLLVAVPLYAVLSVYYQTHSSSYAWIISPAYIGGTIPAVVLLSLWLMAFIWLYHSLDPDCQYHGHNAAMRKVYQQLYQFQAFWREYSMIAMALLVNALLILAINGVYVYVVIHNGRTVSISLQIALVVFKLLYNGRFVSKLIRGSEWLHHLRKRQRLLKKGILSAVLQDTSDGNSGTAAGGLAAGIAGGGGESLISSSHSHLDSIPGGNSREGLIPGIYSEAALVVFNLVIVPIVAALCVDTNCFYELLVSPQPLQTPLTIISSSPSYRFFWSNNQDATFASSFIAVETTIQTEFIPPFTYSGQCASSIIATYEPVFVLLFLANLFLLPLLRLLRRIYFKRRQPDDNGDSRQRRQQAMTALLTGIPTKPEVLRSLSFDRRSFVVARVTNLSILLTFGWVFPPLAILIALVEVRDSIYTVAALQQYIIDVGSMQEAEKELGWHVKGIAPSLPYLQIRYLPLGTICLGLLLYDIAADQLGLMAALWVPLIMSLTPWMMDRLWLTWQRRRSSSSSIKHVGGTQLRVGGVYVMAEAAEQHDPSSSAGVVVADDEPLTTSSRRRI